MFDSVNKAFVREMLAMKNLSNVILACTGSTPEPGTPVSNATLDAFTDMEQKLDKIQKSLEDYLEKKRQQFPRFYFISSDDLSDYHSAWSVVREGDLTRIRYEIRTIPSIPVPQFVVTRQSKSAVHGFLTRLSNHLE